METCEHETDASHTVFGSQAPNPGSSLEIRVADVP